MVLGTWSRKDTLYGEGYSVISNGDLAEQLNARDRTPARIRTPRARRHPRNSTASAFTPPPPERHITEGSFFVGDDRTICQMADGQAVPVDLRRHDCSRPTAR